MKNLITAKYKQMLAWEHENTPGKWGHTAKMYVSEIVRYAEDRTHWLDYGAGSGSLQSAVGSIYPGRFSITEYEPSRKGETVPKPHDYVVCIDVLEHVEPELLIFVLDDLQRVTLDKGYFTISCRPAKKILQDGRNAHLIIQEPNWWCNHLSERFLIDSVQYDQTDKNLKVVVYSSQLSTPM